MGHKEMRFHVLAVPHTVTSEAYSACAFTQKVLKFCKMMTSRGHTVYHYGHERSKAECFEHITVTDDALLKKVYGDYDWKKDLFKHDINDECTKTFNENASREISVRKRSGDFLLMFWGIGHLDTAKAHAKDLICVEPGIGSFGDVVTPFAVFESYAVMHHVYAKYNRTPRFMDAVVPNYFEQPTIICQEEFEKSGYKFLPYKGYALIIGRVIASKGIQLAIEACAEAGLKLVIAGQGDIKKAVNPNFEFNTSELPFAVSHVGYISPEQRNILLSGAKCLMCPSLYAEPFGGSQVEAQMAGVPVITTDWGAFAETVEHGVTGYRCRILEHFVWALRNVDQLDSDAIKKRAVALYGFDKVSSMYEEYFSMILKIKDDKGFYSKNPQRSNLDWLKRTV
jgi:glycosyltransferase involved in cell wall biosynthesis